MKSDSNVDQETEKTTQHKPFELFQPLKQPLALFNFATQPSELIEMLKKNPNESQSFKLQPSIINVAAFKEIEKAEISEFSTHLNTTTRGRKPNALKKLNDIQTKSARPQISKFEVVPPQVNFSKMDAEARDETWMDENGDTEIKRQLKAHQFDSEAEDLVDFFPIAIDEKAELCFVDRGNAAIISKKITKQSKKVFDLIGFITKRENETNDVKTYACKYCPKVFARRAALGGHTAKNHPHQSDSYRIRQESLKNRKIERERFDYFKTIENK